MFLARTLASSAVAAATAAFVTACSGGTVNVGSMQEQQLNKTTDGASSGDGQTCSLDGVVWYDAETGQTRPSPSTTGQYSVGQTFKSPDGCNDCTCTKDGIACTTLACSAPSGPACATDAKLCPDGKTYVSRTGPSCEFAPCPGPTACTQEAMLCPDGKTYVSRTGPSCDFASCP